MGDREKETKDTAEDPWEPFRLSRRDISPLHGTLCLCICVCAWHGSPSRCHGSAKARPIEIKGERDIGVRSVGPTAILSRSPWKHSTHACLIESWALFPWDTHTHTHRGLRLLTQHVRLSVFLTCWHQSVGISSVCVCVCLCLLCLTQSTWWTLKQQGCQCSHPSSLGS